MESHDQREFKMKPDKTDQIYKYSKFDIECLLSNVLGKSHLGRNAGLTKILNAI